MNKGLEASEVHFNMYCNINFMLLFRVCICINNCFEVYKFREVYSVKSSL